MSDQASSFEIPAGIPPPGVNPNFINPQTLAPTIIAFSVVMMTWTLSFVMIRLYADFHAPRGLGIDGCKDPLFQSVIELAKDLRFLHHCDNFGFRIYCHANIM